MLQKGERIQVHLDCVTWFVSFCGASQTSQGGGEGAQTNLLLSFRGFAFPTNFSEM